MASQKKTPFLETEKADDILTSLKSMTKDPKYNTVSSYSTNGEKYPDHQIPFVDKHMAYICAHPNTDPDQYLANLRLITRKR